LSVIAAASLNRLLRQCGKTNKHASGQAPGKNRQRSHRHGKKAIYAAMQQSQASWFQLRPTALLETEDRHIKVAITPYSNRSEGRFRAAKSMPPNQREFFS
jgi:hypothetical protein